MLKFTGALSMAALMTLALSACASIETRGLPKCTGHDRRPLNADLWDWQKMKPGGPTKSGNQELSLGYAPSQRPTPAGLSAINNMASADQPQWNIAASEAACG